METRKQLALRGTILVLLLFTLTGFGFPSGEESPRILAMKEVLRLTDESGEFSFRYPGQIKTTADGNLFVADEEALFHFDSSGRYLGNLVRKGEGPGEVKYFMGYSLDDGKIYIKSSSPTKILIFTGTHQLESEIRIDGITFFSDYLFSLRDWHYFFEGNDDIRALNTGKYQNEFVLLSVDSRGQVDRSELKFRVPIAVHKSGNHVRGTGIAYLNKVFDGSRYLYVSHEERYAVYKVDLASRKIVNTMRRSFSPVPYRPRKDLDISQRGLEEVADRKYFNDIGALRCLGEDLMVFTSHLDEKNRVLVDRYSSEGRRIDSFFLTVPGVRRPDDLKNKPLCFDKDFFWTSFVDDDDNPVVVKYRVDWAAQ